MGLNKPDPPSRQPACRLGAFAAFALPAFMPRLKVNIIPAKPAFGKQHGDVCGDVPNPAFSPSNQHVRKTWRQREHSHCLAVRRWPRIMPECAKAGEARTRFGNRGLRWRINPFERARIAHPPQRAFKREC